MGRLSSAPEFRTTIQDPSGILESKEWRLTCQDNNLRFLAPEIVDSPASDLTQNLLALNHNSLTGFRGIGAIFLIIEFYVSFIQFDLNAYRGEGCSNKSDLKVIHKRWGFNRMVGHTWPRYGVSTAMSL